MNSPDLEVALRGMRGAVRRSVSLAPYTHVRIGGMAEWFIEPFAEEDAAMALRICRENDISCRVLGGGSNLLVDDAGVAGAVIHLGNFNRMTRDGDRVTAGAGVTLASLLRSTKEVGLAGLEKLTGIPAQVGGAVAMNAGTKDGETFDHLVSLTVLDPDGNLQVLARADCHPQYRNGGLGDRTVLQATWELAEDDPNAIFARFSESLKRRNATQPVSQRSVGCVFQNPPGDTAGRLIEAAGCKTLRIGEIEVSGVHANYFVNLGSGTYADFRALMVEVADRVEREFGVRLTSEVKIWQRA
jgi:UDP-N-acetylmuramate dehydrogenase